VELSLPGAKMTGNFRTLELLSFDPMSQSNMELSLPNTNYQRFIQTLRSPSTMFPIIDW